ncbi:methylcrotonoyl-CoA carboxylase beta chain, mitochondrial isoform X3 [Melanerpes formicivorus]|uniref:methylcrotonoyl-CoA carboxylase beta chain, mitochondrial isoform X3 n=1 Tax=Melanerpes formicivorus TaxID=211600 RepID=UPI00358FD625
MATLACLSRLPPEATSRLLPRLQTISHVLGRKYQGLCRGREAADPLQKRGRALPVAAWPPVSKKAKHQGHPQSYPVLDGRIPALYQHVFEENLKNSEAVVKSEPLGLWSGAQSCWRLPAEEGERGQSCATATGPRSSSFATACGCCSTTNLSWSSPHWQASTCPMVMSQLLAVSLSELFPDKMHGGRLFYNEALMSAMRIPQVAVVCGSCIAGGAYVPTMAEEVVMIDKISSLFLGGPPLVKAATGEDVSAEDLGGAKLHCQVSGCSDHFAGSEEEAFECLRNVISTLNYEAVPEQGLQHEAPLYSAEELLGLAPQDYCCSLPVKLILSRLLDGSRFQEFKAGYGTTLVTGFGHLEGHLLGVVANNGELSHQAALKGSHFVQLCSQRSIPILFLQNTAPQAPGPRDIPQAEAQSSRLKAQASMMAAVACAAVPKITVVIGGCFGSESYAMCGRSFSPNFLFLWPNARIALVDPRHLSTVPQAGDSDCAGDEAELRQLKEKLEEESSAFYSSARLWDDGVILPQDTRKVVAQCLEITEQQKHQVLSPFQHPVIRM